MRNWKAYQKIIYLTCGAWTLERQSSLLCGIEVPISLTTVGFVPLYGGDQTHKVLALFDPEDTLTAVALYLADQWWAVEDIVKTSNTTREGIWQVKSLGERVVLYVLNRIIYRKQEMESNEVPFLCHRSSDYAKILWRNGQAIGFYSVKPSGSSCTAYLSQCYRLPVMDTMFVRKKHQGKEFELQMLEDFVDSFTEEALGLRYPLSSSMYRAGKQYLEKYPGDQELLWEVEGVGDWFQRILISSIFQKEARRLSASKEGARSSTTKIQSDTSIELPPPAPKASTEQSPEKQSQSDEPLSVEVQDVQGEAVADKSVKSPGTSKEHDIPPVSTRTRSSHLKRPKIGKKHLETEQVEEGSNIALSESKIMESKEQIVENFKELIQQLAEEKEEVSMIQLQEGIPTKPGEHVSEENSDVIKIAEEDVEQRQVTEVEPVNGDIADDLLQPMVHAEKITEEVLDAESNLEPGDTDEKSLTTLVSVNMDLEKSFEDSFAEPSLNSDDVEMSSRNDIATEEENTMTEQGTTFKERIDDNRTETSISALSVDFTDNGPPSYEKDNPTENPAGDTVSLESCNLSKSQINIMSDKIAKPSVLCQGPLLVVELEDLAFQQNSEGQKGQSADQSEESAVETDQSAQKSVGKGEESSSEDAEPDVPVRERRGLRRKPRGYRGPAKKRGKLSF
ncbi:soluble lamin-associated protein of 75 kDa isoform X2 [Bombina bombina]|uniref:soluble lamin-associated protein of 75 kDa isoform X2 n=1 Tax=Bombina bombina TaxID=8345 RepID=UPI00235B2C3D|nr:soluble lamin-associated protein of 75 kDa isoform X2 [Bombina bombina]